MIVLRVNCTAKWDRQGELVEVLKSMRSSFADPDRMRIYTSHPAGAPLFQTVWEMEYESLADLEQFLPKWFAVAGAAGLLTKWTSLVDFGGDSTVWNLVE